MRTFLAAAVAAAGLIVFACGDFGGDDPKDTPDGQATGTPDGGVPDDALVAAETLAPVTQTCTPDKPFGPGILVAGLDLTESIPCFVLSADETTAYFTEKKALRAAPWSRVTGVGTPVRTISLANASNNLGCVSFTNDEEFAFNEDFFSIHRQKHISDGGYEDLGNVPPSGLTEGRFIGQPFVDRVTSDLYVGVIRKDQLVTPPYGIARAIIHPDGTLTPFVAVAIGNDESVHAPVLAGDSKSIYFVSTGGNPTDPAGTNQHIQVATRSSTLSPFENPRPLTELNGSPGGESPTYITRDGCQLFYLSSRGTDGGTGRRIYVATRTP